MKQENKVIFIKYIICFCVASLITLAVFWGKGFFAHTPAVNMQVLSDGFTVSGLLLTLLAGMLFVSGEGGLIGVGFVMRSVIQMFIPMGRKKHEFYAQYRERKLSEMKKRAKDHALLVTGLTFLLVGIVFTVIWYVKYYSGPLK